jgi:vesicle-fusing ATPase
MVIRHAFKEFKQMFRPFKARLDAMLFRAERVLSRPSKSGAQMPELFREDFNFASLGIGGLDEQMKTIFRRAFASRMFPPSFNRELGLTHVKGMVLYGPPGTGKTLIARQIGRALNCAPPKIVTGPDVLSKYFGESEANIRELFADAESDYAAMGDESRLHLVIIDEMDAICRTRGGKSETSQYYDTVSTQLLTKMDGVEALPNVLVIGLTNRLELIDSALLRPGRFELHIEVSRPDQAGRQDIFAIHTAGLAHNQRLGDDVDLSELAAASEHCTGAEISSIVRAAVSHALNRQIGAASGNLTSSALKKVRVSRADFMLALEEVKPAFKGAAQTPCAAATGKRPPLRSSDLMGMLEALGASVG